jgi:hypothetical protein
VEQREAEDAARLIALRDAAGVGFGALDRGAFKELDGIDDLQTYLNPRSGKSFPPPANDEPMAESKWWVRLTDSRELNGSDRDRRGNLLSGDQSSSKSSA